MAAPEAERFAFSVRCTSLLAASWHLQGDECSFFYDLERAQKRAGCVLFSSCM